jgi:iron complex transport system substrate-binding protein
MSALAVWCRLIFLLLAGQGVCAQAIAPATQTLELLDQRGKSVVLARPAQRIVSLLPSLTESICALQACDRLVGTDRFSNHPPQVRSLPKLGDLQDAQIERIVQLHPDVVLVAAAARITDRLEALGLNVLVFNSNTHADVRHNLNMLSNLIGQPAQGEQLWARIQAQVREAATQVPAQVQGQRVYFEIDGSIYAAGQASFIGETLHQLGLRNVVPSELGPFPKLNPEFIVRAQPQIVMAETNNLQSMRSRSGWWAVRAFKHKRTCGFEGAQYELLIRPGPRLGEAAAQLAACLSQLPNTAD